MSDADKLLAEVNRRKERARQLGLPGMLTDFYDKARCYPAWKNNHPTIVPQSLVDIREVDRDSVEFVYCGDRYAVTLRRSEVSMMPNGESLGEIELRINGDCILEVSVSRGLDDLRWYPFDVTAFVEGPWVSPFKVLAAEAAELYNAQARIGFQDLDSLRARFGIK